MKKEIISTDLAPAAIGAYSQAVKAGNVVYVSGQLPMTKEGEVLKGSIKAQTRQAIENLNAILNKAGSSLESSLMITIYISDMENFKEINNVYSEYFTSNPPARACVEVAGLPKGVDIEMSAIALIKEE